MDHRLRQFLGPPLPLPPDVQCDGIPRTKWNRKAVTLRNAAGVDVAKAVCHNVDPELVLDADKKPLGEDRVAVQIAESLCKEEVPSTWMFSMQSWHIKLVFLNGASLYDHHQTDMYNNAMAAANQKPRKGLRRYESTREKNEIDSPPKKEALLTIESVTQVATESCCAQSCCQYFPRGQIEILRSQLHVHDGFYERSKCLLEANRQIHKDVNGKQLITLKGREVCPKAWWIIHGISKSTFYRYKDYSRAGKEAEAHGNLGLRKPRLQTLQATATLRTLVVSNADRMPHKTRTLDSGERVTAMVLPSAFRWSDQLPILNKVNAMMNLPPISSSGLSNIRQASFPEYAPKARGDSFARCGICDEYKQLRCACTPFSEAQEKYNNLLNKHLAGQKAHRELYYRNRYLSEDQPDKMLTIIHDKMDHSKTVSPHFSHKTKSMDSFMKLPISVTRMIAHGHGDVRYAHYGLGIFPMDSNHTIGSIAKLLRDVEGTPKNSSRHLFSVEDGQSALTKALLNGSEACLDSLLPQSQDALEAHPLPPILTLQLDNCSGDNKNRWVFAFCSLLVFKGIFKEIYINFLIVGHTHEDIDALFGRWSTKLKSQDYPTLPRLMKSFMDVESHPVITHLVEEVPDFKTFVDGYLGKGGNFLEGHSFSQQFKFSMDSNGWPIMEYKNLCTDSQWLPENGKGIRLWDETEDGRPKVPMGSPLPLKPHQMKGFNDVKKGIAGFIAYWNRMANDDDSGDFRRKNDPIKEYWKGVKVAFNEPLQIRETLQDGFWPASRVTYDEADRRQRDGTLREEEAEDRPFVGRRRDRPPPSFRVARDVHAGSFVVVQPANNDPKPFWLARAITKPNPDPSHVKEIQIQYWTPVSNGNIDLETYDGWDANEGVLWREDTVISPTWSRTDCIMTAWFPRFRQTKKAPRVSIPNVQIEIIKASVTAFMVE